MIEPVRGLQGVCDKHGLRLAEVSYRWLQHHSAFQPGDHGVILGASRAEQLETAILDRFGFSVYWSMISECSRNTA